MGKYSPIKQSTSLLWYIWFQEVGGWCSEGDLRVKIHWIMHLVSCNCSDLFWVCLNYWRTPGCCIFWYSFQAWLFCLHSNLLTRHVFTLAKSPLPSAGFITGPCLLNHHVLGYITIKVLVNVRCFFPIKVFMFPGFNPYMYKSVASVLNPRFFVTCPRMFPVCFSFATAGGVPVC